MSFTGAEYYQSSDYSSDVIQTFTSDMWDDSSVSNSYGNYFDDEALSTQPQIADDYLRSDFSVDNGGYDAAATMGESAFSADYKESPDNYAPVTDANPRVLSPKEVATQSEDKGFFSFMYNKDGSMKDVAAGEIIKAGFASISAVASGAIASKKAKDLQERQDAKDNKAELLSAEQLKYNRDRQEKLDKLAAEKLAYDQSQDAKGWDYKERALVANSSSSHSSSPAAPSGGASSTYAGLLNPTRA